MARLNKSMFSFRHMLFIHLLWISGSISSDFSECLPSLLLLSQQLIFSFDTFSYHLFNFSFTFIHLLGPFFPSTYAVIIPFSLHSSSSSPLSLLHSMFLLCPISTGALSMCWLPSSFIYPGTALIGNSGLTVSTQVVFVTVSAERYG